MKRILLCADGSLFSQSSYQYAAWFAKPLNASIEVLYVTDARQQAALDARNLSGSIGIGASDLLLQQLVSVEHERAKLDHQRAKLILQNAQQILEALEVPEVHVIHEMGFLVDCLHEFEAAADLILLGKRGESADFASGHLGANVERIVRASHKPCLITSRQYRPIQRVLLAYDGSPSNEIMLNFFLGSGLFQGLECHLISVCKTGTQASVGSRLADAQQRAQATGFHPVCTVIEGYPETAIAKYSEENKMDLLMMGAYGHRRIRHLVLGSTTAQILRSSNIPVLVFR